MTGALPRLAAVAVGFPLLTWVLGSALLARVAWLDRAERFAASWGVGFAVLALSQFLAFVTGAPPALVHAASLGAVLAAALGLGRVFRPPAPPAGAVPADAPPVGLWLLGLGQLAAVQVLLPGYLGGGWAFDWFMHYRTALVFLGDLPVDTVWVGRYSVASRTPLYNLTLAAVMSVAGREFWVFQEASVLTNGAFLLPVFLLLRGAFGPRAARLGTALGALNLWALHEAWFTWSKMLTVYYLLLGLHFYLRWLRSRPPAAGPFLGFGVATLLGFMTHQVGAVYGGALLAHAARAVRRDPARRPGTNVLAGLGAAAVVVAGTWYGWVVATFEPLTPVTSTPITGMIEDSPVTSPWTLPRVYAGNVATSVVPDRLIRAVARERFSIGAVYIHLTALYFSQLPGALTLSLTAYLAARAVRARGRVGRAAVSEDLGAVLTFALLGGLGALVLHPAPSRYGVAHNVFVPTTLTLALLGWGALARDPNRWARVAGLGAVVEFLGMFWSHVEWVYFYLLTGRIASDLNWQVQGLFQLTFLHDLFPRAAPAAAAVCLASQAALVRVVAAELGRGPDAGPDPVTPAAPFGYAGGPGDPTDRPHAG